MESVRLQKYFTDCAILSRRAAEDMIREGRVKVNGEVATLGQKVDPEKDVVEFDGKLVKPAVNEKYYILLYKPRGIVTTLSDEKGRTTVADLVADLGVRVYPVGRLDMDSDGLLILTNDGALTERLTHPRHEIPKHYHVTVPGVVTPAQLGALNSSFLLDGYTTRPAKVSVVRAEGGETVLSFELYEGRNRQIRRMCDQVGLRVRRLSRVAIGKIGIGDLVPGRYRHLTPDELAYLRGEEPSPASAKQSRTHRPKSTGVATSAAATTTKIVRDAVSMKHVEKIIKDFSHAVMPSKARNTKKEENVTPVEEKPKRKSTKKVEQAPTEEKPKRKSTKKEQKEA